MNDLEHIIKDENLKPIQNRLISALQFDLNSQNGDVEKIVRELRNNEFDVASLWQKQKGSLEENFTQEYLNEQIVELSYNFSKERFELCQKIGKELFPIEVEIKTTSGYTSEEESRSRGSSKKWILLLAMIVLVGVIMIMLSSKDEKQVMNLENIVKSN